MPGSPSDWLADGHTDPEWSLPAPSITLDTQTQRDGGSSPCCAPAVGVLLGFPLPGAPIRRGSASPRPPLHTAPGAPGREVSASPWIEDHARPPAAPSSPLSALAPPLEACSSKSRPPCVSQPGHAHTLVLLAFQSSHMHLPATSFGVCADMLHTWGGGFSSNTV